MYIKTLTRTEEKLMLLLWEKREASIKELLGLLGEPKPAYNTVSTIIRILQKKGFVFYRIKGKNHIYFPIIDKDIYLDYIIDRLLKKFYDGNPFKLFEYVITKNNNNQQQQPPHYIKTP
jgi:predicted transcriptional regulator